MEPTRQAGPPPGTASLPADGQLERSGPRSAEPRRDLIAAIHTASTTAGIALLLLALLAAFGDLVVAGRLVVEGDAVQTAANLANSQRLFRLGIASLLLVAGLDVVVAWALFIVFEPVSGRLSMLAAWFRVAYAAIFVVAIAQLAGVLRLLPQAKGLAAQVLSGVQAYEDIWSVGLVLFGCHLIVLGVLAWRASYAPNVLGILLVVAGLGYAVDGLGVVLVAGYSANVAAFTFVGEVVLIVWLLVRGVASPSSKRDPGGGVRHRLGRPGLRRSIDRVCMRCGPAGWGPVGVWFGPWLWADRGGGGGSGVLDTLGGTSRNRKGVP